MTLAASLRAQADELLRLAVALRAQADALDAEPRPAPPHDRVARPAVPAVSIEGLARQMIRTRRGGQRG